MVVNECKDKEDLMKMLYALINQLKSPQVSMLKGSMNQGFELRSEKMGNSSLRFNSYTGKIDTTINVVSYDKALINPISLENEVTHDKAKQAVLDEDKRIGDALRLALNLPNIWDDKQILLFMEQQKLTVVVEQTNEYPLMSFPPVMPRKVYYLIPKSWLTDAMDNLRYYHTLKRKILEL